MQALLKTCRDFSADVSFAVIRVEIRFGIAMVVIIRIIATTIRSSRRAKPRSRLFTKSSLEHNVTSPGRALSSRPGLRHYFPGVSVAKRMQNRQQVFSESPISGNELRYPAQLWRVNSARVSLAQRGGRTAMTALRA